MGQSGQILQGVLEIVSNERSRKKEWYRDISFGIFNQTSKTDQNDVNYRAERSLLANKLILSDLRDKSTDQIAFASIEGKVSNIKFALVTYPRKATDSNSHLQICSCP